MPARLRNMASTGPEIPQPIIRALRPLPTRQSSFRSEDPPEQVGERPEQEGDHTTHYGTHAGVLERGESPPIALPRRDEGLDRVPLRRGPGLSAHHGAAYGVHHCHIGTQETQVSYLPHQARPLHPP